MNNCLINIQYQRFLAGIALSPRQVHLLLFDLCERRRLNLIVIAEHLERDDEVLECAWIFTFYCCHKVGEVVSFELGEGVEVNLAAEELELALATGNSCADFFGAGRFIERLRCLIGVIVGFLLADDVLVGVELPLGLADLLLQLGKSGFQVRKRGFLLFLPLVFEFSPQVLHHIQVHGVPRLSS